MSLDVLEVHPDVLDLQFWEIVDDFRTERLFGQLAINLREEGINLTFEEYIQTVDRIGYVVMGQEWGGLPRPTLLFSETEGRDEVHGLFQKIFAGTHGKNGVRFEVSGDHGLTLVNFGHEDLCTLGRIGTALFLEQFGDMLGDNKRLAVQRPLEEITTNGALNYLPLAMRKQIAHQQQELGPYWEEALLTSGVGITWLGYAVRECYGTADLPIQRRWGFRPAIEKGLDFFVRKRRKGGGRIVSGTTTGEQVKGQIAEEVRSAKESFGGDAVKKSKGVYDVIAGTLSGDHAIRGLFALARAGFTYVVGMGVASKDSLTNRFAAHRREEMERWVEEHFREASVQRNAELAASEDESPPERPHP